MTATSPSPASSQVSRARCIGLVRTSAKRSLASAGRSRSASLRPLSVNGMSVVPVWCPLRLHAVSPWRIVKTFKLASASSDVVGFRRTDPAGRCRLAPLPARDIGHVVAVARDVFLVLDQLVLDRLLGVGGPRPELG